MASTGRLSNFSRRPLGQRTSTQSILVAAPRPKWTRMSLLEMKLEPLRTSSIKVRGPAFTRMRAPMASRVDLVGDDCEAIEVTGERDAVNDFCDGEVANAPMVRKATQ